METNDKVLLISQTACFIFMSYQGSEDSFKFNTDLDFFCPASILIYFVLISRVSSTFFRFVFQGRLEELMESYGIRGGASLWLGAQEEKGPYTRWRTHSECSGCGVNAPGQSIRRRHCRRPCCRYFLPVRFRFP